MKPKRNFGQFLGLAAMLGRNMPTCWAKLAYASFDATGIIEHAKYHLLCKEHELGNSHPFGEILVNAQLEVHGKLLAKLFITTYLLFQFLHKEPEGRTDEFTMLFDGAPLEIPTRPPACSV